mgnify:CR=1 FL=1
MKNPQYEGEYQLEKFYASIRKSFSHLGKGITAVTDKKKYPKKKSVIRIYDTINLSPAGKSLKDVGELLDKEYPNENLRKLQLEKGVIENMLKYRKDNTKGFCEYGLQDAKIPVYFSQLMRGVVFNILGNRKWDAKNWLDVWANQFILPSTTTSIGEKFLKDIVWNNKNHKYYPSENVSDIHSFYGKVYARKRRKDELPWINLLGYRTERIFEYDKVVDSEGKLSSIRRDKPKLEDRAFVPVEDNMPIIKKTYYGGRNEQFFFGITPIQNSNPFHDYDLVSAYPTAMMCIGRIDWLNEVNLLGKSTEDIFTIISDFENYASYFHIKSFKFPSNTKYPTIPVRNLNNDGILFPLEGGEIDDNTGRCGTYINGIEIYVALQLGCEIELGRGVVFKMDKSFLPYEKFILTTLEQRRKAEKNNNDFLAKFWKEMMNSLYGKTAQGISEKRVYDIQKDASKPLSESNITSYPIVSLVTSMVRGVLGIMMNNISNEGDYFIGNITTDGFCTDFPADENLWEKVCDNKLINIWRDARGKMEDRNISNILQGDNNEKNIIEEKHTVTQYLGWRTRGQSTLKLESEVGEYQSIDSDDYEKDEEEFSTVDIPTGDQISDLDKWDKYVKRIMNPKGGLKPPSKDKINQNLQTTWWFLNRFEGLCYSADYIRGLKDIVKSSADSTNVSNRRKVSMDFDFKRLPDLSTLTEKDVDWVDISNTIRVFFNPNKKDITKPIPSFTASFDEVILGKKNDFSNREKTYTTPTFQTTPIKDLNEYEKIRKGWREFIKNHGVDIDLYELGFEDSELINFHVEREEWNLITQFIDGIDDKDLESDLKRQSDTFNFIGHSYDGEQINLCGLKYLKLFYYHIKGKGLMNDKNTIIQFFNEFNSGYVGNKPTDNTGYKTKGGDLKQLVNTIILCNQYDEYGLGFTKHGLDSTTFAVKVWEVFFSESQMREIFKVSTDVVCDDIYEYLRKKIQNRMFQFRDKFKTSEQQRRRVKRLKFYRTEEREDYLLMLKMDFPTFNIEPFLGSKSFGEWIDVDDTTEKKPKSKKVFKIDREFLRQITLSQTPTLSQLEDMSSNERDEYIQQRESEYSEEG